MMKNLAGWHHSHCIPGRTILLSLTMYGYAEETKIGYRVLWHAKEMNQYAGLPTKVTSKTDDMLDPIFGTFNFANTQVEVRLKSDGTMLLPWIQKAYKDNSGNTWNRPKVTLAITTKKSFFAKDRSFIGINNTIFVIYHMLCVRLTFDQKRG